MTSSFKRNLTARLTFYLAFFMMQVTLWSQIQSQDSLIQLLEQHLQEKHIPGAMVSIVTSDSVLFQGGIGYADLSTREPVDEHHLFRLGSISKSITALGVLHVLFNSDYDLNTPLSEIVGDLPFRNQWETTNPVRVAHLLEHTTGFEDFRPKAMYNRIDSIEPFAEKMVYAHANSLVSRWKPGSIKAYCNPGYIMAGQLIEEISGMRYSEYIRQHILVPLSMTQSGYYFKQPAARKVAQGYTFNGGKHQPMDFRSIEGGPAGGFCSNAREMSNFLQFMLNRDGATIDSLLFTKAIFDRIENSQTTLAAKMGLKGGYGLGNFSIWKNGALFYGHDGGIDGFMSRYVYSREADIGVAVSINRLGNATEIVDLILDQLIGEQKEIVRQEHSIPSDMKMKYSGFYGFKNSKRELFSFSDKMLAGLLLEFRGDSVLVKSILGKQKYTLRYAGDNLFYKGKEETPSVALLSSENDNQALWINESYTERESWSWRLFSSLTIFLALLMPWIFMIFSLLKIFIRLIRKEKPILRFAVIWLASLSYLVMLVGFSGAMSDPFKSGVFSFDTLLVYLGSLALPFFTVLSFFRLRNTSLRVRTGWYQLILSISLTIICGFLWSYGFLGLKLWSY